MTTHILLHTGDSVVTALTELSEGDCLTVQLDDGPKDLTLSGPIPYAHKIAVQHLSPGEPVKKYGQVIGVASRAIVPGDWVHVHNVESTRARGDVT